jgi:hypothetical protein
VVVALTAASSVKVKLERDGIAHGRCGGLDRCLSEERAAEISMKHGSSQIIDRFEPSRLSRLKPCECRSGNMLGADRRPIDTGGSEGRPHRLYDRHASKAVDCNSRKARAQHLVDRGQRPKIGILRTRHVPSLNSRAERN